VHKLFRSHATNDDRIAELEREISRLLTSADVYIDVNNLRGQSTVPLRTTQDITADVRFADIVLTRTGAEIENTGRVACNKGIDISFCIPVCLLRAHAYLVPPALTSDVKRANTALVHISARATLPAQFSDAFLSFAATLSKTSQMLDIEVDAGKALNGDFALSGDSTSIAGRSSFTRGFKGNRHLDGLREKLSLDGLQSKVRQHVSHMKETLQGEYKEATMDKVINA
jgi:hypothetical protein